MPRRRRQPQHLYNIEPAPQPPPAQNWLTQIGGSLPLPWVLGALVGFAVWYGTSNSERVHSSEEIKTIKTTLAKVGETTAASTKEQDERRAAMAKEFLASNKEIASKVSDLATAIAVQQTQAKTTSDALVKISDQLQQLNAQRRQK